jgi:hypothetical protein
MNLLSFHCLCLLALVLYQVNLIDARHAHGTHHSHYTHRHNINKNGEDSALPISSPVSPSNRSSEPLLELRDIMARQSGVSTAVATVPAVARVDGAGTARLIAATAASQIVRPRQSVERMLRNLDRAAHSTFVAPNLDFVAPRKTFVVRPLG